MLKSMTGFGRGEAQVDRYKVTVEIRAVNHRFAEVVVRLPKQLNVLEDRIRKFILDKVARGRIEVYLGLEEYGEKKRTVKVDKDLALAYYNALRELKDYCGFEREFDLNLLPDFPNVFVIEEAEEDVEEIWPLVESALHQAMDSLLAMRRLEGQKLSEDLIHRIKKITQFIEEINERAPLVVEDYRKRLLERLQEVLPGNEIDENRLLQELTFFAERSNITEEIVRLRSHLAQLSATLEVADAVGRKFEFILQEINREVNTIGSKANDFAISTRVVEIKSELEKMREQIQNIE